jgi:hypothetical protein
MECLTTATGPFALPEAWSPPAPRYRDEPAPRACPHCRATSTRFRDLGDRLVCLACGCSFSA